MLLFGTYCKELDTNAIKPIKALMVLDHHEFGKENPPNINTKSNPSFAITNQLSHLFLYQHAQIR